jgi:hypothetical protein
VKLGGWSDHDMLAALALQDVDGLSAQEIGTRLGATRNAVLGMFKRVRDDDAKVPDQCLRPENCDGGMPARWWSRRRGWVVT